MDRDRSLDEFAEASTDESTETSTDESADTAEECDSGIQADADDSDVQADAGDTAGQPDRDDTDGQVDDALDVEPASSTYRWSPEGVECAACGRVVDRLWSDGDEHVCIDCKEW
ncbi:DUF7573 domain-containing protein [Halobellus salinisoli]|uniref:DUF7573 domain-containing protein n=1 Tax=Halobellus salinisoli TaxID=3108500 RepID=UPI00300B8585